MLVVEKAKALAMKLEYPARVLETIPTARLLRQPNIIVAPHRLDEVRVLRNLGIDAPSPILHYYDWPGRFKPYEHQRETAAFLTLHNKALVLNDIGTGKTNSALWASDYLIQTEQIKRVLILSPLSTLERVWGDGIFMGFPKRKFITLHGTAERRRRLLQTDVDYYIINHDGFPIILPYCDNMFDLIIVDEAAVYRNHGTDRFKMFRRFMDRNTHARLWLMTGTPTPNAPTDAWALAKLVESPFCPHGFTSFRDLVMEKLGNYKWVPRPNSAELARHVLQPAVRYTRDECFDLPETIVQTRKVPLSKEQNEHYERMLKHFITEVGEHSETMTAANEAVKMQKLVQISCGVAYDDNGTHVELDCSARVRVVNEIIEEAGEKVIVFVPLTGALNMLERELAKRWTVGVVNGAVSSSKRNVIFHDFQNAKDPRVLIAHPATMAHGLTLTSASTVIWYGPITSNEQYTQANGRIERIGKRHVSNVIHIEATQLERRIYERLRNKQTLQGALLDMIKQQTK